MKKQRLYEKIIFRTKLTEEQVASKLTDIIEFEQQYDYRGHYYNATVKPYIGTLQDNSFTIERVMKIAICYLNPYRPVIKGNIYKEGIWTKVSVMMKLSDLTIIFMTVFLTMASFIFISGIIILLIAEEKSPFLIVLFGLQLSIFIFPNRAFRFESEKSKKDLLKVLEAEIE